VRPQARRPRLSENIRVRSVVGRFLEHHRIFYFHADGEDKLYLSSADWMDRNFFRRIEIAFPVLDPKASSAAS
jgi:polyphosphate kinase